MTAKTPAAPGGSRERFIQTTLQLIAEEDGSLGVNLRGISRRMGCAHTNVYNYFDSYHDLLWAAFRRALRIYGDFLTHDVDTELTSAEYLRRVVTNLATFPQQNPGIYRFIGSDPIDVDATPDDILGTVTAMKEWFWEVAEAAAGPTVDAEAARATADVVLAYIDGETLNLINGRVIPAEDLAGRVVGNALRLFELLAADAAGGGTAGDRRSNRRVFAPPEPALIYG